MRRRLFLIAQLLLIAISLPTFAKASADPRLKNAFRRPANNGWTFVHLKGTPAEIGFQHGYLLAPEIEDSLSVFKLELTHEPRSK